MTAFANALVAMTMMASSPPASAQTSPRLDHVCAAILASVSTAGTRIDGTTVAARAALMTPINQLRNRLHARRGDAPVAATRAYGPRERVFDVDQAAESAPVEVAEAMRERLIELEARIARSTLESAPVLVKIKGDAQVREHLETVLKTSRAAAAAMHAKLLAAKTVSFHSPRRELGRSEQWAVFFGYVASTAAAAGLGHALGGPVAAGATAASLTGAWWVVREPIFSAVTRSKNWMIQTWETRRDERRTRKLDELEQSVARAEIEMVNAEAMLKILDEDEALQSIAYESFPVTVPLDPKLKRDGLTAASINVAIDGAVSPEGRHGQKLEVHNLLFHNGHSHELHVYVFKAELRSYFAGVASKVRAKVARLARIRGT